MQHLSPPLTCLNIFSAGSRNKKPGNHGYGKSPPGIQQMSVICRPRGQQEAVNSGLHEGFDDWNWPFL